MSQSLLLDKQNQSPYFAEDLCTNSYHVHQTFLLCNFFVNTIVPFIPKIITDVKLLHLRLGHVPYS